MNGTERIQRKIRRQPTGKPFTIRAFFGLASRENVYQVFSRLEAKGEIKRVSRGVYVCPKENPYVGWVKPSVEAVVQAIASSGGYELQVEGAEAARRLGLTTQMPTRHVFYTQGPRKKFMINNINVEFKKVEPRKLLLHKRPAGLAISALLYLGGKRVNPGIVETIRSRLSEKEFQSFKEVMPMMPAWMAKAVQQYEKGETNA